MNTQFKKGILELCTLELIKNEDKYGYKVVQDLSVYIETKENTVYPILHRLMKDECLTSYLKESDEGPDRKYYKITEAGKSRLEVLKREWEEINKQVEKLLGGESYD